MDRTARKSLFVFSIVLLSTTSFAYGQTSSSKDVNVVNTPGVNVVNAPTVGIDPVENIVRLPNTETDPLAVKLVGVPVRRPFQMDVNLEIRPGVNSDSARLPIPAGKRLVIEDVSAVTFQPEGQGLMLDFTTPADDGCSFEEVHSVVLISHGSFGGLERSTAHERTMIFADESVQTSPGPRSGLDITVILSRAGMVGSAGVRVTFSGYIEDLPRTSLSR
jgi:hypothetical protein